MLSNEYGVFKKIILSVPLIRWELCGYREKASYHGSVSYWDKGLFITNYFA